jgi:hypothetical protein
VGHSYFVECKRPLSGRRLDDNLSAAYAQLVSRLTNSTDRGIVAIAIEKVSGLDLRIQPYSLAGSPAWFARSEAESCRAKISKFQHTWADPRVVGVMAIIRFLMRTSTPSVIGIGYSLALIKFATARSLESAEEASLDRITEMLNAGFVGAK